MEQLSVLMRFHIFFSLASLYGLILRAYVARVISLLCHVNVIDRWYTMYGIFHCLTAKANLLLFSFRMKAFVYSGEGTANG